MNRLLVVSVGKTRRGPAAELEQDYFERIGRFLEIRSAAIKASKRAGADERRREEAAGLDRWRPQRGRSVALAIEGKQVDSDRFSRELGRWLETGEVALFIGGPDGLDPAFVSGCDETLSLSRLTFPHELAKVLLLEQLYRALAARSGHPYVRH